jgi:hypothetical protein
LLSGHSVKLSWLKSLFLHRLKSRVFKSPLSITRSRGSPEVENNILWNHPVLETYHRHD